MWSGHCGMSTPLLKPTNSMMELIMKWYRYVHPLIFVASFMPLVLSLVPFWQGVAIPLVALLPYAANEIMLARREKKD